MATFYPIAPPAPAPTERWSSFTVVHNGIAAPQGTSHEPCAVYDPVSNRTFFIYRGVNGAFFASFVDHGAYRVAPPVFVGEYIAAGLGAVTPADSHGIPTIMMDGEGHLHVVSCAHGSPFQWYKSPTPREVEGTWDEVLYTSPTGDDPPWGTYASLCYDETTEAMYAFYRAGQHHHDTGPAGYPHHEQGALVRLLDGDSDWEDICGSQGGVIDTMAHPDLYSDVYLPKISAHNGDLHLTWNIAHGTAHDDLRANVYAAIYDTATDTLRTHEGTGLGDQITWAEHSDCEVYNNDGAAAGGAGPHWTNVVSHHLDEQGRLLIVFNSRVDADSAETRCAYWDGNDWEHSVLEEYEGLVDTPASAISKNGNQYRIIYKDGDGDLKEYTGDGSSWDEPTTIIEDNEVGSVYGVASVIAPRNAHEDLPAFWHDWCLNYLDPRVQVQAVTKDRLIQEAFVERTYKKGQTKELWYPYAQLVAVLEPDYSGSDPGVWEQSDEIVVAPNVTEVYLQLVITTNEADAEFEILFRATGVIGDTDRNFLKGIREDASSGPFFKDIGWMPIHRDHKLEYRFSQRNDPSTATAETVQQVAVYVCGIKVN